MDRTQALQAMIEAAGLKAALFPANSRYQGIETATFTTPEGRTIVFLRRRFVPPAEEHSLVQEHTVVDGDRIDNIAAKYLGDPEQFWRVCDANAALRPAELTEAIGTKVRITLPYGIAGGIAGPSA
jgi:hypothetical protein